MTLRKIFIGGYTKSGTTYVGRAFGSINHVYARGEMDYFRQFFKPLGRAIHSYNVNLGYVNEEVYDGRCRLEPASSDTIRHIHDALLTRLFFNDQPIPEDARILVEKSPRNIFFTREIEAAFPDSQMVCVYRDPAPVARSLLRHMAHHRDPNYADPDYDGRISLIDSMIQQRWPVYARILEDRQDAMTIISYENAAQDVAGLVDFIQDTVLGETDWSRRAPPESLTKDAYLARLPEEARAKSLVQTGTNGVSLTEREIDKIKKGCHIPKIRIDF